VAIMTDVGLTARSLDGSCEAVKVTSVGLDGAVHGHGKALRGRALCDGHNRSHVQNAAVAAGQVDRLVYHRRVRQ